MKKISVTVILGLITISPLFRGLFFPYETYFFLFVISVCLITYFYGKILKNEPFKINRILMVLGTILIISNILNFTKAVNPRENFESLLLYLNLFLISHVMYDYYCNNSKYFCNSLMVLVIPTGFLCAIVGLLSMTGKSILDSTVLIGRIGSTFQYSNTAAIYFAVCVIFSLTISNVTNSIFKKSIISGIGNIIVFALFMTGSRGGIIVSFLAFILLIAISPRNNKLLNFLNIVCILAPVFIIQKKFSHSSIEQDIISASKWLLLSLIITIVFSLLLNIVYKITYNKYAFNTKIKIINIIVVTLVGAFAIVLKNKFDLFIPSLLINRFSALNIYDADVFIRIDFFKDAFKLILKNWLFGLGGGGWKAQYQSVQDYYYTAASVHNQYLQIFVENGISGFVSYGGLIITAVIDFIITLRKEIDVDKKIYASGLLCALLAILLHSTIDFDLSFVSITLILWILIAASKVNKYSFSVKTSELIMFKKHPNTNTIIFIIISSILLCFYGTYFMGAYSKHNAIKYMEKKDYISALSYYEEASRFDPFNTTYAFELAKLYNYFARNSKDDSEIKVWFNKARVAAENSVYKNQYYPAHINTLVKTYIALDLPILATDFAELLVKYQRYNNENYILLAQCYLLAAESYLENDNLRMAHDYLIKCISIRDNPIYVKSKMNDIVGVKDQIGKIEEIVNNAQILLRKTI